MRLVQCDSFNKPGKTFSVRYAMGKKETEEAIEEARRGGLKRFDSVEALFADLNADDPRILNRTGLGLRLQKTGTIQDTRRTPAPFAPFRELEAPSRLLQVLRRADGISLVHRTRKLAPGGSRETTLEPPLLCRASANALGWLPESGLSKRQAFRGSIRLGVATAEKAMCQTRKAASRLRGSSG